jgi:hypothetical protein
MNKREYSRIDFIGSADVLHGRTVVRIDVLDLSAQGMHLGIIENIQIGDEVTVRLNISQDEDDEFIFDREFEFSTVVVFIDEKGVGVKILSTTVDCFMRLISIIIKHDGDGPKIKAEIKKAESHFKFQKGSGLVSKAILNLENKDA